MSKRFAAAVIVLLALMGGLFIFIYAGVYNVAATDPHWRWVYDLLDTARVQSVKAHASDIKVPQGLESDARVLTGTDHYAAHCAVCHGAPGVPQSEIALGMYPRPAELAASAKTYKPNELFWILKNGIKMSGMPAWADHADDELWATVAFIMRLPTMTEEDYGKLIMMNMEKGGHDHGAGE